MRTHLRNARIGADDQSIKSGSTVALRRLVAEAIAANGEPTVIGDGFDCANWVAILFKFLSATGTSFDAKIWFWDDAAGAWWLYTDFGTAGTKTVATATNSGVYIANVPTFGMSRVYVEVLNFVGLDEAATVTGQASAV